MQTAPAALWYCATCGRDACAGDRHCRGCGDSLDAMRHVVDAGAPVQGSLPGAVKKLFCSECGLLLRVGGRYCSVCGTPVEGVQVQFGVAAEDAPDEYASITRRAGAWCLDLVVVSTIWLFALAFVIPIVALSAALFAPMTGTGSGVFADSDFFAMLFMLAVVGAVSAGTFLLIDGVYQVVSLVRSGRTLGALAAGIRVLGEDGQRLSPGRAAGRWLGSYLSWLALGLGFVLALVDERGQTLHDKLAGSIVVRDDGRSSADRDGAVRRVRS